MTSDDEGEGPPDDRLAFYLWHLEKVGVLDPEHRGVASPLWAPPSSPLRVAIIDSGCCRTHPNLPSSAIEGQIDFCATGHGVIYGESEEARIDPKRASVAGKIDALLGAATDPVADGIRARANLFASSPVTVTKVPSPGDSFAGHGTSCAGLVAGRATVTAPAPSGLVPYFGVNPFAVVIPIATPYSAEISPLISALLHAVAHDAAVILMPRGVNDRWKTLDVAPTGPDLRQSRFDDDPEIAAAKEQFEYLLRIISNAIPVVVAAGNDGRPAPAYPASLVAGRNAAPGLIVVGAMNHRGYRSSYSSGTYQTGVTVYAPSDDEETLRTDLVRVDPGTLRSDRLDASILRGSTPPNLYSTFAVLAIDVPGRTAGTANVDDASPVTFPANWLYTTFGGTSAACSIVAGLISLMQTKAAAMRNRALSGAEIKAILLSVRPPEPSLSDGAPAPLFLDANTLVNATLDQM